jgi:hypothetical protein
LEIQQTRPHLNKVQCGFRPGGHLVAAMSTHFERRLFPDADAADKASCHPDFAVLSIRGIPRLPSTVLS